MVDFTNCDINKYKYYGGKNGSKICVVYNNEDYMLKFQAINKAIEHHSYSNNCISEYISCNIIKSIGLKVQDTYLGIYNKNNVDKTVVACKDFTTNDTVLKQFAELKNSYLDTSENGYGTELKEVIEVIDSQSIYDSQELKEFFWDMFIVDAFLGNFDRHNGNWGFLINERLKKVEIAPIYDCASCLYPQLTDEMIKEVINSEEEIDARIYVFPTSALKEDNKKINYFDYISSLGNEDCNKALLRVFPKINMDVVNDIVDNTDMISSIRKEFYKKMLMNRYNKILKYSYDKLCNNKY